MKEGKVFERNCNPYWINESNFCVYGTQSKYKSLLVSEQTTVDELIQMLLSCYSSKEPVEQFSLYEVCEGEEYQRKLHPDDSPLKVTQRWTSADRHLRIRRNPDYNQHRRKVSRAYLVSDCNAQTPCSQSLAITLITHLSLRKIYSSEILWDLTVDIDVSQFRDTAKCIIVFTSVSLKSRGNVCLHLGKIRRW